MASTRDPRPAGPFGSGPYRRGVVHRAREGSRPYGWVCSAGADAGVAVAVAVAIAVGLLVAVGVEVGVGVGVACWVGMSVRVAVGLPDGRPSNPSRTGAL